MRWTFFAGLVAVVFLCSRPANACLNGVIMQHDEVVKKVASADRALRKGQPRRALALVRADHYLTHSNSLLRRIKVIKAVAHLRLGRTRRAERQLRRLLRHDKKNPYLLTRLAESLAGRTGDDPIEAWRILTDLDKRDLIPDAEGYAALARLRERNKDSEGRDRALAQCLRRARTRKICPSFGTASR